ncbi:MAG: hypothetical protein P4M07_16875 [Xanthobacteraceae bacterium]|nr:hypothetical protein [Xanthobacteraceae bacterium]
MSRIIIDDETAQHPLTPDEAYDPGYWRHRAEQAREASREAYDDDDLAAQLRRIAVDCDRLAERAAAILLADEAA